MQELVTIIRDLLVFVGVMVLLLVGLVLVISRLPDHNPLKRILSALSFRVGATLAAGLFAIPIEPIPGIDVIYDIGAPVALIWFWYTFFRNTLGGTPPVVSPRMPGARGPVIEHEP